MIGTIRKHSKVLWAVIITVVVITFVFWGSQPNNRAGQGGVNLGSINGEPIDLDDYRNAQKEVMLLYFFSAGDWPGGPNTRQGFDLQRETYFRLLMLHKLQQAKIHVGDDTVAKVAADYLRAINRGNPVPISAFEQNVLRQQGLTALDFERYIRNLVGIQQLIAANGVSGKLITPQEARVLYEREHEELSTEAVFFSATNYQAEVSVTPELTGQFFTNQMARYRLPERVQVSYVAFDYSNVLAQAEAELVKTNFNEMIETAFTQIGTNYYKEAKTPEEIRAKIREDLIRRNAERLCKRQAAEFAITVDALTPKSPANLDKLAAEQKLTVKTSAAFDREEGPSDMVVGADFIKAAFSLTAEDPVAGPFSGRDAAYAIALKARLPSEVPPFDAVRERVTADFKQAQAAMAARNAGDAFARSLTNGLASGKKFSSLCTEANVKPITLPPVSLSTRSVPQIEEHVNLNQYKNAAFTTPVGQASGFVGTSEGGFVVFVREKMPIEMAKLTADMPAFLESVRRMRQNEAYNSWFSREAERGLRDTPIYRPQQQPGQAAGAPKRK